MATVHTTNCLFYALQILISSRYVAEFTNQLKTPFGKYLSFFAHLFIALQHEQQRYQLAVRKKTLATANLTRGKQLAKMDQSCLLILLEIIVYLLLNSYKSQLSTSIIWRAIWLRTAIGVILFQIVRSQRTSRFQFEGWAGSDEQTQLFIILEVIMEMQLLPFYDYLVFIFGCTLLTIV